MIEIVNCIILLSYRNYREAVLDLKMYQRRTMQSKCAQSDVNVETTSESLWKHSKMTKWPSICVYFGWILCISTALICAFFTILYSLEWGGDKSNKWLSTFLLTITESISGIATLQVSSQYTIVLYDHCII